LIPAPIPVAAPAPPASRTQPPAPPPAAADAPLREAARRLESAFLAEMLGAAGLGRPPAGFGGGAGEEQFASFLREAQATEMVRRGGIGLSEALFEALKERARDAGA
jgi:Rod binding domain-containing protein